MLIKLNIWIFANYNLIAERPRRAATVFSPINCASLLITSNYNYNIIITHEHWRRS